jgi:hypothetical protein
MAHALTSGQLPLMNPAQDLHLLDVLDAARLSVKERQRVTVSSTFTDSDLSLATQFTQGHDHTRPVEDQ